MDPRHLVQLATILEKGSLTQACRHLHLTQPTLTHNMQTLEMQVGGRLFERSRFGVRSTPLGETLAREGRGIARRLRDAAEASVRHRSGRLRQVRLGTGPLVGAALLPGLTQALLTRHPGITVTLHSDRPHLLVEQLIDGRHDLVIAPSWLDRPPPGIDRCLLVHDDLGVFCGVSHPLAAGGVLGPGDADGQRWISLGTASPFDQNVREMLAAAGVADPLTDVAVVGEAFMLLRLLDQGTHLSVLPHYPMRLLREHFPLVELALPVPAMPRPIHLWCRSQLLEDAAFAAMRETILGYVTG